MTMPPPPLPGKRPKPPKEPRAGRASRRGDDDFWDPPATPRSGRGAGPPTSQRQATSDTASGPTDPTTDSPADDESGEPSVSWVTKLDDARLRGRIAMVVGIAVIPLAVLFSGITEYRAASGQPSTISSASATPVDASGTTAPPVHVVPPGDYTALCAKLDPDAENLGSNTDLRVVSQVLLRADVDGYIAASPDGFKPILEDLKRTREAAAKTLEMGTGPVTQAQKAVLPDTYLPNLVLLSLVIDDECR